MTRGPTRSADSDDPSGPEARRYLIRFGYDGVGFDGWARQPGRLTVEGEILRGLRRLRIVPASDRRGLAVASRTDRGVSARANAVAIRSTLGPTALLRALNGLTPSIWFTHLAEIPAGVRPRDAEERTYRYWERPSARVPPGWPEAAERLTGRIDVRSFGRGIPPDRPTWRTVASIDPRIEAGWHVVEVRAPSFVWGMVRKIVGALRAVEDGRLTLGALTAAARGERRLTLSMAEPERLVLWETGYSRPWTHTIEEPIVRRDRALRQVELSAAARSEILHRIHPDGPSAPPAPRG